MTGTVTWRDGSPAGNFPCSRRISGRRNAVRPKLRSIGADGRFNIDLLEGRTYTLTTPEFGPRDRVQLTVHPFRAEESMAPVSVVIPRRAAVRHFSRKLLQRLGVSRSLPNQRVPRAV